MKFYAYLWLREDGTPWYVGKGTRKRAFVAHDKSGFTFHPPKDKSRILILPRASEQEAFDTEMELIRNWGRKDLGTGCLRNLTGGGDGSSGYKHTPEELEKMRTAMAGRRVSPATEVKIGNKLRLGKTGYKETEEHKQKISKAQKGHRDYTTPEGIEKMRLAKLGKKPSDETRRRMGESQKKAWLGRKARGELQLSNS